MAHVPAGVGFAAHHQADLVHVGVASADTMPMISPS